MSFILLILLTITAKEKERSVMVHYGFLLASAFKDISYVSTIIPCLKEGDLR